MTATRSEEVGITAGMHFEEIWADSKEIDLSDAKFEEARQAKEESRRAKSQSDRNRKGSAKEDQWSTR